MLTLIFIAVFGLVVGSFLGASTYRILGPGMFFSHRSACPHCGTKIPASLNIPVFSYFYLQGKSRCCAQVISPLYPIIETITMVYFVLLYNKYPFYLNAQFFSNDALRFAHMAVLGAVLILVSAIDFKSFTIPDKISYPMMFLSPLAAALHPDLSFRSSFLGVAIGGLCIYAIAWIYFIIRRNEGIGMGDAKLMAFLGGWLGYQSILPTLFIASMIGSVFGVIMMLIRRRFSGRMELPFGPFLSLGAMVTHFYYPRIMELF